MLLYYTGDEPDGQVGMTARSPMVPQILIPSPRRTQRHQNHLRPRQIPRPMAPRLPLPKLPQLLFLRIHLWHRHNHVRPLPNRS